MDYGAVDLGFVHVGDGGFGVDGGVEEDVGCAAVGHDFGRMLVSLRVFRVGKGSATYIDGSWGAQCLLWIRRCRKSRVDGSR